jgi:hypothetical protein
VIRILIDLFLQDLLGVSADSPLGYMLLAAIALGLIALAIAMLRRPGYRGPRRAATELFALVTVTAGEGPQTWAFTVQARPGQTRVDLLELVRGRLPEQLRSAPIAYCSIEPNVICGPAAVSSRFGRVRPTHIAEAWHTGGSDGREAGSHSAAHSAAPHSPVERTGANASERAGRRAGAREGSGADRTPQSSRSRRSERPGVIA